MIASTVAPTLAPWAWRQAAPGIHLHAFSPQGLVFFAEQDGIVLEAVLECLRAAGLGSVLQIHASGLASTCTPMAASLDGPARQRTTLCGCLP
ncbi:hypothetical protein KBY96_05080 [Cyanobium sp. ATX 6A2]|uniref:hypothetical protein n=1 Tax=Cyanobium sp. ATX 6A2 TaxID=2823700 RepID=UPI0020CC7D39|nr:hypothetical protein [Cyanobium sp. ATX 6A2]MCP9887309.1 hypothetical protein [Cyanobium sp. ATX 6A2]